MRWTRALAFVVGWKLMRWALGARPVFPRCGRCAGCRARAAELVN